MATCNSMRDLHHRHAVSYEPIPKSAFLFYIYCLVVATEERIEEQHGDLNRGGGPLFSTSPFVLSWTFRTMIDGVGAFGRPGRLSPP